MNTFRVFRGSVSLPFFPLRSVPRKGPRSNGNHPFRVFRVFRGPCLCGSNDTGFLPFFPLRSVPRIGSRSNGNHPFRVFRVFRGPCL